MSRLAMLGGAPAVPAPDPVTAALTDWPVVTAEDEQAVLRVLRGDRLTAASGGDGETTALEREWAEFTGTAHCVAVASGTAALEVALAAAGIGPGDEVVVPALTMNATAHAVRRCGAEPVFADIEPDTYTLDPAAVPAVLTGRTAALLPVHLHGLPAAMDALGDLAGDRGLAVVEDAAQAHGARHQGSPVGSLGVAGCFSLHPSKNLPTCGEGGLVTTDSDSLHRAALALRNFGERPPVRIRTYVAHGPGWNARIGPVQAAFTRSQLSRLPQWSKAREESVGALLNRLAALPGLRGPVVPADRTHAWHIVRLRLVPEELGLPDVAPVSLRRALHRALRAEGVPVSRYQTAPLPAHPAFRPAGSSLDAIAERFPVTGAALDGTLCLQRRHLNPAAVPVLAAYADAFEKVWDHLDTIRTMARARPHGDWRDELREGPR
ncbi:DegT/DnrJ/EryC1/StrS family aminotransferase [Streptomyces sp. SS7]|uniref:DegT/DnrJ/EryC1/StrS family aminotransferase n=1 Tax=Streptomyces sp. SS7 TaxID=3108485 RepID=UPI0030ECF1F4